MGTMKTLADVLDEAYADDMNDMDNMEAVWGVVFATNSGVKEVLNDHYPQLLEAARREEIPMHGLGLALMQCGLDMLFTDCRLSEISAETAVKMMETITTSMLEIYADRVQGDVESDH